MARANRRTARRQTGESVDGALREQLIEAIAARIKRLGLSRAEAARMLGITEPRLSLLVHGHTELFSLDALVKLAVGLNLNVRLRVTRPYGVE